jgi:hypothetical protein
VHIEGLGGYFISYRKLEQWVAACCTLMRFCRDLNALEAVWSAILREAQRYTEDALIRLTQLYEQWQRYLSTH